eukprot:364069-Chlamydomonas_euryale.AAC.10
MLRAGRTRPISAGGAATAAARRRSQGTGAGFGACGADGRIYLTLHLQDALVGLPHGTQVWGNAQVWRNAQTWRHAQVWRHPQVWRHAQVWRHTGGAARTGVETSRCGGNAGGVARSCAIHEGAAHEHVWEVHRWWGHLPTTFCQCRPTPTSGYNRESSVSMLATSHGSSTQKHRPHQCMHASQRPAREQCSRPLCSLALQIETVTLVCLRRPSSPDQECLQPLRGHAAGGFAALFFLAPWPDGTCVGQAVGIPELGSLG